MVHAIHDEPVLHMGPPLTNGKLAMWIFLATEVMFFTGLIGTYLVLRNGQPTTAAPWPTPEQVHLKEWQGAVNTFVLICSSLTVVLAHYALGKGQIKQATLYIAVTLALGGVFLVIKGFEYYSKYDHQILPGRVYDHKLDGPRGTEYLQKVAKELKEIQDSPYASEAQALLADMEKYSNDRRGLSPQVVGQRVNALLKKAHDEHHELRLTAMIPYGNMWASCYFAMTGFHALHVVGGLVIFVLILLMAAGGKLGIQHESFFELTGLYWHFVDIVWIFLFPLL